MEPLQSAKTAPLQYNAQTQTISTEILFKISKKLIKDYDDQPHWSQGVCIAFRELFHEIPDTFTKEKEYTLLSIFIENALKPLQRYNRYTNLNITSLPNLIQSIREKLHETGFSNDDRADGNQEPPLAQPNFALQNMQQDLMRLSDPRLKTTVPVLQFALKYSPSLLESEAMQRLLKKAQKKADKLST